MNDYQVLRHGFMVGECERARKLVDYFSKFLDDERKFKYWNEG